ncbi:MAG: GNAT family N-acetyltransferase [Thermoanaerobaculia bacterium]
MHEPAADIRRYQPRDREAVRAICQETAYGGVEEGVIDPVLLVDLMTRAYTDFGAGALWVAEREGQVVGYLAGSWDEGEFHRVQARRVVPSAVTAALGRGLLLRRQLWRLVGSFPGFLVASRDGSPADERAYPGHLHLNLVAGARGRSLGARLVETFLSATRERGVPGVRAVVYESNGKARRFFERLGFHPLGRSLAFKPTSSLWRPEWKVVYGRVV